MSISHPKRHHFVPKVYLRSWANEADLLAIRRRSLASHFISNVVNVTVEKNFHGSGPEATARESFYADMERNWPLLRDWITKGNLSSGPERRDIARFLAFQKLRTREQRARDEFFETAINKIAVRPITADVMRDFLITHWGLSATADSEVEAAKILVDYFERTLKEDGKEESYDASQVASLVQTFSDNFEEFDWRIERMPTSTLFTSDCPVTYWRPRSPQDKFEGIGLEGASEVWFPVDPQNLLVMSRNSGKRGLWSVSKKRLLHVNREIASRSFETTIGNQRSLAALDSLILSPKKPALRFNIGPGFRVGLTGHQEPMGDVLHQWIPAYDDAEMPL